MELNKFFSAEDENIKKILRICLVLSIFSIIIGLAFIPMTISILYGFLYGLFALWFSLIFVFYFNKKSNILLFSWGIFIFRILTFMVFFFLLIFIFNGPILSDNTEFELLQPINSVSFFLAYMIFSWSTFLIPFYDYFALKFAKK